MNKIEIKEIVLTNVRELVDTFDEKDQFSIDENTVLFGEDSSIDSLSLVSIIVDLETYFTDEGFELSLTDDQAMTREISPFDSVQNLVDYIDELINQ